MLLVEDILDSGRTLSYVCDMLRTRHPASIRVATLLDKPERRVVDLKADYVGTRCRTSLWWATAWILTSATATCRISVS